VLGLTAEATIDEVDAARRMLAKSAHPDVGGSVADMQLVNAAADEASRRVRARHAPPPSRSSPSRSSPSRPSTAPLERDHPSFTIEARRAEAFEALLLVAAALGDLIDDDPPNALEVALAEPLRGWCRLDLVPDAGATTVSLTLVGEPVGGHSSVDPPPVETVRDAWIVGLNELDWDDPVGGSPSPP